MKLQAKRLPISILALSIAGLILASGCGGPSKTGQEGVSELAPDTSANSKSWPADIPVNVPKLAGGTVFDVTKSDIPDGTTWGVTLTNTSREEVLKYQEILKTAGWKTGAGLLDEESIVFGANLDKTRIDVAWAAENKAANITVLVKK